MILKIIFVVLALLLFWGAASSYQKWRMEVTVAGWPKREGKLLSFEAATYDTHSRPALYQLKVDYEYEVDGKSYRSQTVSKSVSSNVFAAETYLTFLDPVAETAAVHYNPEDAADSVLHAPENAILPLASTVVLALAGLALAILGVKF